MPPAPFAPSPFPNIVQCATASGASSKVKFCNGAVLTKSSNYSSSQGDEAGTLKGMVGPFQMGKVVYKAGSSKVKAEGKPVVTVTSMTAHNGANANAPVGAQLAPSQTTVLVA